MDATLEAALSKLANVQAGYKRNFYILILPTNKDISLGDFVFIDPEDGKGKTQLGGHALGLFSLLGRNDRTLTLQRWCCLLAG